MQVNRSLEAWQKLRTLTHSLDGFHFDRTCNVFILQWDGMTASVLRA
jgi:hypothetical protein